MTHRSGASQESRPQKERRRFPRYPWTILTEVKTSDESVSEGSLLNLGRGGGMLETRDTLPLGDPIRLKVGGEEVGQSEGIVMLGRTVWGVPGDRRYNRYGVAFLRGQGQSYERLWRSREVSHSNEAAKALGLMFVDLNPSMVEKRALSYIDRDLAFSLGCIPIKLRGERLMVAMVEPGNSMALEKLRLLSRCKIVPVMATPWAIKNTLFQCWGAQYVPSERDRSEDLSLQLLPQERKPRILALASSTPDFAGKRFAINLAAVFNRYEKRVVLVDLHSGSPVVLDGSYEQCELMILTLPMDTSALSLDWAIRADEAVLVVSPSHWQKGCLHVEAAFSRFVEVQKRQQPPSPDGIMQQRVLELSIVCSQISDMRQGFKTFRRVETRVHQQLDMREPGFDIRLHYTGGILDDRKNIRKAEKIGVPITILKPHSPASQCMSHVAQSLLRPTQARDPRISVHRSLVSRIFG